MNFIKNNIMTKSIIKGEEVREILERLHTIARELDKPFDSGEVICEYNKRYGGISLPIERMIIRPIYFPKEECVYNEPY